MKFDVLITQDAEDDIFDIYTYILKNDSENNANYVFEKLKETCISLISFPERGHIPPELQRIDVFNYKEIHFKSYRIIYQTIEKKIYIHCVLDGRRELQEVLQNRLLR